MAKTTTVRVSPATRDSLNRLALRYGIATADLIEELVARREQDELLNEMNRAYEVRRADPDLWQLELAERSLWASTYTDGLGEP